MIPVTLPIFHHTDQTFANRDMALDYDLAECEVRRVRFYTINAIAPYYDADGTEYTSVYAGTEHFICSKTFKETQQLIES